MSPGPPASWTSSRMPPSRPPARDFSCDSMASRIDEAMRLSSRYISTRPTPTSSTCDPNKLTPPGAAGEAGGSAEDGQRVGLHVRGHVVAILTAVVLLVEDRRAALPDAAHQARLQQHLRSDPQRLAPGSGHRRPDRPHPLGDELPLRAEVLPGPIERIGPGRPRPERQ